MIKILTEENIFKNINKSVSFRPSNYALFIIYQGTLEIELSGVLNIYQENSILVVSPLKVYRLKEHSQNLKVYILVLDREVLRARINFNFSLYDVYRLANFEWKGDVIKVEKSEFDSLLSIAKQIYNYLYADTHRFFKAEIITGLVTSVVYMITGLLIEKKDFDFKNSSRKEEITIKFFNLVSLHFKEQKELRFYADHLSLSVKYLSNCVREITGVPPTTFIADILVNEAKIALLNSKATISMITDTLGYSDQYAFGKFFKKHTGLSPRNFRKQNQLSNIV
ncbi:AraC family transcriptional regulator [Emticicia sp. 21SJ11W-3]|uniref:helix-turn-helix domain-containing protein n=1 Tax=Emticicia sp. 21SJ11W-3 TaxID=2916755 RepID=UPI00209E8601|nr:helix-turn-helix domain-containing protein [Emticicia sp. 21SJ11W-3]UTA66692.1 helix-turn-helix domain-containing protein [Emticicia sp. 21SJ11W-3]